MRKRPPLWIVFTSISFFSSMPLCAQPPVGTGKSEPATGLTTASSVHSYRAELVAEQLDVPWSMVFAPDGTLFVTERPGRIRVIRDGRLLPDPLPGLQEVSSKAEIGLLGIALHPDFSSNPLVYVSHGVGDGQQRSLRVVRYRLENSHLTSPEVILDNVSAKHLHAGCRLLFAPDRTLFITTGDAGTSPAASQLDNLIGKTLRVTDDGKVPPDNPFVGRTDARPEIWSYGHRNAQGMAWEPGTGRLFQCEHGPSDWDAPGGGDEVNIIRRGAHYGWPVIHHRQTAPGMEAPWAEWTPAIAPGGMTFYSGDKLPRWKGNAFVACLKGECVLRIEVKNGQAAGQERLFTGEFGRIREVAEGPDGYLYFATSNKDGYGQPRPGGDKIYRIVPH